MERFIVALLVILVIVGVFAFKTNLIGGTNTQPQSNSIPSASGKFSIM